MHYDIPMSEKELPIEESTEIFNSKKLTKNNCEEKINNEEDNSINISKSITSVP